MKKTAITALALMCVSSAALADDKGEWMQDKVDHKFEMMDTNKDGSISAQEHDMATKQMFTETDTSGDRMISRDELEKYMMNKKDAWLKTNPPKERMQ